MLIYLILLNYDNQMSNRAEAVFVTKKKKNC